MKLHSRRLNLSDESIARYLDMTVLHERLMDDVVPT